MMDLHLVEFHWQLDKKNFKPANLVLSLHHLLKFLAKAPVQVA